MSVQSVGQSSSDYWLQRLLASYGQQSTDSSQSSVLSLLSQGSDSADSSSATSSASDTSASSAVGSFNDILTALLNGNGTLGYDMETGSLTATGQTGDAGTMPPPPMQGADGSDLTREETETQNDDGSTTRSVTMSDADGNVVGTEKTVSQSDGSFTTTITMTGPDGKTGTRTITGQNTEDGFTVSENLTDSDGNVLESGTQVTAADGSVTSTVTHYRQDGGSVTESESYDADGALVSTSTTTTPSTTTASTADATGTTGSTSGSSSASSSPGSSSGSSSSSSDSSDTTTTVTMTFTAKGIEETTTVTDADGNVVSQTTKEIPLSASTQGSTFGSSLQNADSLADIVGQYAAGRYGSQQYSGQQSWWDNSSEGGGLSLQV
jgi:hypothetical protein